MASNAAPCTSVNLLLPAALHQQPPTLPPPTHCHHPFDSYLRHPDGGGVEELDPLEEAEGEVEREGEGEGEVSATAAPAVPSGPSLLGALLDSLGDFHPVAMGLPATLPHPPTSGTVHAAVVVHASVAGATIFAGEQALALLSPLYPLPST